MSRHRGPTRACAYLIEPIVRCRGTPTPLDDRPSLSRVWPANGVSGPTGASRRLSSLGQVAWASRCSPPVAGWVIRGVGGPAGPDDSDPSAREDPDGVGLSAAARAGASVGAASPGGGVPRVVGEAGDGHPGLPVGGVAEADGAGLARGPGDRCGAAQAATCSGLWH